ncbi:hypothetical protein HHO41_21235 [Bacillus sp. DNRA2]|uniref:PGN_0703 family putative restriction endonuclease n=1 Tax=Bacillus sp. DNRA2 TaxID=2723053 RepID=UPI00145DF889|nr:hypothetical protein [Bacillus sp. DNRA2]NMD72754.1 hypothetical protein [Bacillus sp. DNRA2]
MVDFQSRVKGHLGDYKKNTLLISQPGTYLYKKGDTVFEKEYDYILPRELANLNLLEKYRNDFNESDYKENITFHKYFHHLNSSQAVCINFFYPLIKEQQLDKLLKILSIKDIVNYNSDDIVFEKKSMLEKENERKTNFDFFMKLGSGVKLHFEIKYSETEFGKQKEDPEHIRKFEKTYFPILKDHPAIKEDYKNLEVFLRNYQAMRNLLHIAEDSYVIFLYPNENIKIREEALAARKEILENGWKDKFILLTWEDLVHQLSVLLKSKELINYYKEFNRKYLDL